MFENINSINRLMAERARALRDVTSDAGIADINRAFQEAKKRIEFKSHNELVTLEPVNIQTVILPHTEMTEVEASLNGISGVLTVLDAPISVFREDTELYLPANNLRVDFEGFTVAFGRLT